MTRKTIDEAYFHIGDGGITIRTVEKTYGADNSRKGWMLEHSSSLFGISGGQISLPLATVDQVDFYVEALTNIRDRIAEYRDGKPDLYSLKERSVTAKNGYRAEYVWELANPDRPTNRVIGMRFLDSHGKVVGYTPHTGNPIEMSGLGSSTDAK